MDKSPGMLTDLHIESIKWREDRRGNLDCKVIFTNDQFVEFNIMIGDMVKSIWRRNPILVVAQKAEIAYKLKYQAVE